MMVAIAVRVCFEKKNIFSHDRPLTCRLRKKLVYHQIKIELNSISENAGQHTEKKSSRQNGNQSIQKPIFYTFVTWN